MESRSPSILLSAIDDNVAAEKGRLLAAQAIAQHPEQRKRVEGMLGLEYCKRRWPEAYHSPRFFRSILDRITFRQL